MRYHGKVSDMRKLDGFLEMANVFYDYKVLPIKHDEPFSSYRAGLRV